MYDGHGETEMLLRKRMNVQLPCIIHGAVRVISGAKMVSEYLKNDVGSWRG
jgi:hypothetical protein